MSVAERIGVMLALARRMLIGEKLTVDEAAECWQMAQCLIERIRECEQPAVGAPTPGSIVRVSDPWRTIKWPQSGLTPSESISILNRVTQKYLGDADEYIAAAVTCPSCGQTSTHREDIARKYCGNCRAFHADLIKDDGKILL